MEGLGAGLAALAFWGFIAAVVVGGIWYAVREKAAQHQTLRRMIDSGRNLLRRSCGDMALADDLSQQTFLKVWLRW